MPCQDPDDDDLYYKANRIEAEIYRGSDRTREYERERSELKEAADGGDIEAQCLYYRGVSLGAYDG